MACKVLEGLTADYLPMVREFIAGNLHFLVESVNHN